MSSHFQYSLIKNKAVLITGGLGFIGSSIAHRCAALGAQITLVDACLEPYGWNFANIKEIEKKVTFIEGDVRDHKLMTKLVSKADIVFHMAAQVGREISMENPKLDADINCMGMLNILESVRRMNIPPKIIYAGSRGQVGEPVYLPVDEKHPDHPTDIYGIDKLAAEKYLFLYHQVYGIPVVSLRLNNVYGPRCQMHAGLYGILNWFMANAMQDQPITVYGKGRQTRDYVFIDDVVDAFIRSAVSDQAVGEMFYVGSGKETVFLDMVRTVVQSVGKGEIVHIPFPQAREKIDIKRFVANVEKIQKTLCWEPKVNLKTGVELTVRYYREKLNQYIKNAHKS
jgi:UDP-glucose 4-epimerase